LQGYGSLRAKQASLQQSSFTR